MSTVVGYDAVETSEIPNQEFVHVCVECKEATVLVIASPLLSPDSRDNGQELTIPRGAGLFLNKTTDPGQILIDVPCSHESPAPNRIAI